MPFVGLITDKKNESVFVDYLSKNIHRNVIFINNKNIDNIKNIKFDSILIDKKIPNKSNTIKKIISNSKNIIVNSDIDTGLDYLDNSLANVITFGFNPKSTVTASSLENDDALICIQRNIKISGNNLIEPQELKVIKSGKSNNPYVIMSSKIIELLYN